VAGFLATADGKYAFYSSPDGNSAAAAIDAGSPAVNPPKLALQDLSPIRFSSDGRYLFARDRGKIPVGVYRFDVATGRRDLVRELSPGDPAGLQAIGTILLSADGKYYAYGYTRALSDLFAVDGFR
jgi:hypothetical protein